jgi:iron complex outermembrane receptor protein
MESRNWRRNAFVVASLFCCGTAAAADDLTDLSLLELMNVEVTGVSRRAEPLAVAPAAIFVVSGADIRASGARTLADALRLVPGLQVARSDAQSYTVTARGFAGTTSDKMEVRIDGRSAYTPLFSGVYWDALDTFLPDVERIEVIRGPGGSVWGANAVNGVINIVTRSAVDTEGTVVTFGGGAEERGFVAARSGVRMGQGRYLRFYAQARDLQAGTLDPSGDSANDGKRQSQGGFRGDFDIGERNQLTLSGDAYDADLFSADATSTATGGNLIGRWTRRLDNGGDTRLQLVFDRYHRRTPGVFDERRSTIDSDLQWRLPLLGGHALSVGAGARWTSDETGAPPDYTVFFEPSERDLTTYSAYAEDRISLTERGSFTVGTKVEHNEYTGYEWQPSARLGWSFTPQWFGWASVSRAVRTPNRLDNDLSVISNTQTLHIGNPDFESETVVAYEAGLRYTAQGGLVLDLATFYNDYDKLRSIEPGSLLVGEPYTIENALAGNGRGVEFSVKWQPLPSLQAQMSYSWLRLEIDQQSSQDTSTPAATEGSSPENMASLGLLWTPVSRLSFDARLRYVDALDALDVDAYTEASVRAVWQGPEGMELAIAGRDLLHDEHREFSATTAIDRAVWAELTWRWGTP